jgi:hypothetical protein
MPAPMRASLDPEAASLFLDSLDALGSSGVPFLVGGAYAFQRYTGVTRHTRDFDVFVRRNDVVRALAALERMGLQTELTFEHWLGKAHRSPWYVDVIFGSGNGAAPVDDLWFQHAVPDETLGVPVELVPAEEMIWSKGYIMERERFDGADVVHLLRARAQQLDWDRLLTRFARHPAVLLVHLLLFGFVYPDQRDRVPERVMEKLWDAARATPAPGDRLCYGTVLSRLQYLTDLTKWGYRDARLEPGGNMTGEQVALWTQAGLDQEL